MQATHTPPSVFWLAVRGFTAPAGALMSLAGIVLLLTGVNELAGGWERQSEWESHMLMIGFGAVLAPIGLFLLVRGIRTAQRKVHIYENGRRAEGTVVAIEESNVTINKQRQWQIRYSYRDLTGHAHECISEWMSREKAFEWAEGQTGQVRYDPDEPSRAYWVGR
jgi:hypothetical protein